MRKSLLIDILLLLFSVLAFASNSEIECESEIEFTIDVTPTTQTVYDEHICYGEDYSGHGFFVEKPERDTVCYRQDDCDHYTLNLKVCYPQIENIFASICEGSTYTQHGFNESKGGEYTRQLQTKCGCDSTAILHLDVISTATTTLFDKCCTNELYNGRGYVDIVVEKDTILESDIVKQGCPSKSQLFITACFPQFTQLYDTVQSGTQYQKYNFDFTVKDDDNEESQYLKTYQGCDSTVTINVYGYHAYLFEENDTICPGDSILWQDSIYKTVGDHYKKYKSRFKMDSIYVLHLAHYPTYRHDSIVYLNEGSSFIWHKKEITTEGEYYDTLKTKHGCDDIYHITVKLKYELVIPAFFTPDGDGVNDTWVIRNLNCYPNSTVEIFDRYGRRVAFYRDDVNSWDGTYDGHVMPSDDYWYVVRRADTGQKYSGHFILKRGQKQ